MSRWVIGCNWADVPHLTEDEKDAMRKAIPPHERDAREFGLPKVGVGAIYPVVESSFVRPPRRIPEHYPRAYGLDVGWKFTAAVFGAYCEEEDTWYIYNEYLGEQKEPAVNASAIRGRTQGWMKGVIDPASLGASQATGFTLFEQYSKNGLDISKAINSVELGLFECYQRLTEGRLIIFDNCERTLQELRMYHRKENGNINKKNDHLMDAMRYLVMSGSEVMRLDPSFEEEEEREAMRHTGLGKNSITGY